MIDLIKFIHIICTLSLVGGTLFCLVLTARNQIMMTPTLQRSIMYIGTLALLTGTLLVYPKHFTFHTPWIQAAYILVISYLTTIGLLKRYRNSTLLQNKIIVLSLYLILIVVLLFVIHDAVTKETFLIQ